MRNGLGVKVGVVGDLLDAYEPVEAWDEMFDASGEARVDYHALYEHVQTLSRADFDERCTTRDRVFRDQGITFALSGEERPFPLDLVPRVLSASEWSVIERGVKQRVRALERFLDDVYGEGEIMRDGVVPRRLVVTSSHFHRLACGGISPPGGVRVHVAGIDLVRDADGRMRVLEDNLRRSRVREGRGARDRAARPPRPPRTGVRPGPRRNRATVLPGRPRRQMERLVTWRMSIEHVTSYDYEGDVLASYNEARISPARDASQMVLNHRVEVTPGVPVMRYTDCWGTVVSAFDVHEAHRRLVIAGHSLVETVAPSPDTTDIDWEVVRDEKFRDRFYEYLAPSPRVPFDDPFPEIGASLAEARSPRETVGAVNAWVRENLVYEPGATDVSTNAWTALELGRGVCQDFAHVALALLRCVGIPARYSSGYLHPDADAAIGDAVTGQSHAWLEAWTGSWQRLDPTNGADVGERHVFVARGRDYGDVTPLKGVYNGPAAHTSAARVTIRRVA